MSRSALLRFVSEYESKQSIANALSASTAYVSQTGN